ncbi:hypothetical protein [Nonomuraea insulae]|uniref:Secreted protein n=1 Tax=Nonomuraea insulae TaxID=1616787 RepID=A0ABW1CEX4_9ACTN
MIRNLIATAVTAVILAFGITFQAVWATSHENKSEPPAESGARPTSSATTETGPHTGEQTNDHTGKPGETK